MFRCATVLVCLATTVVLLNPVTAGAQYFGRNKVQNGRLEFRTLRTEHFDIYYYPEEEQVTRQAARAVSDIGKRSDPRAKRPNTPPALRFARCVGKQPGHALRQEPFVLAEHRMRA